MAKCLSSGLVQGRGYNWIISLLFLKKKKKSPLIQVLLGFIKLAKMHLNSTFGGLGSNFLDTCLIKALLEGFTLKCELCEH